MGVEHLSEICFAGVLLLISERTNKKDFYFSVLIIGNELRFSAKH